MFSSLPWNVDTEYTDGRILAKWPPTAKLVIEATKLGDHFTAFESFDYRTRETILESLIDSTVSRSPKESDEQLAGREKISAARSPASARRSIESWATFLQRITEGDRPIAASTMSDQRANGTLPLARPNYALESHSDSRDRLGRDSHERGDVVPDESQGESSETSEESDEDDSDVMSFDRDDVDSNDDARDDEEEYASNSTDEFEAHPSGDD
jgi:hypothetical protein